MSEWVEKEEVLNQINCWFTTGEYKYSNATHYLNKRISSIKPKINWISVNDKLPKLFENVLTYDGDGKILINWLEEIEDGISYFAYGGKTVTHWMSLPNIEGLNNDI